MRPSVQVLLCYLISSIRLSEAVIMGYDNEFMPIDHHAMPDRAQWVAFPANQFISACNRHGALVIKTDGVAVRLVVVVVVVVLHY